jgi:hypothetical protein
VKSGGIILAYKTELSNFVNIVESESKYILWFKLNKSLLSSLVVLFSLGSRVHPTTFLWSWSGTTRVPRSIISRPQKRSRVNSTVVKLLMINVCGLVKRIQYPEFMELIEGYDILCFVETKTDDADEINSITKIILSVIHALSQYLNI